MRVYSSKILSYKAQILQPVIMGDYKVKDISLASSGRSKIEWVSRFMPVLNRINEKFRSEKPFEGLKIACCQHLEMKTAYLALTLKAGGADVSVVGSSH